MSDEQIEELSELTTGNLAAGDMFVVNDVSDTTDDAGGSPKHLLASSLATYVVGAKALGDISDVTITSIASGEILKWDGSAWINNTVEEYLSVSENGYLKIKKTSAPADAELDNNELAIWWDEAGSAVQFKAKNNSGTVLTGSVALT